MSNPNRLFRWGVAVLAAATIVAFGLSGWALYGWVTQRDAYRQADHRVWRAVICQIETAVQKQHLPDAKERAALRFYDHLLTADVQTAGCGLPR